MSGPLGTDTPTYQMCSKCGQYVELGQVVTYRTPAELLDWGVDHVDCEAAAAQAQQHRSPL